MRLHILRIYHIEFISFLIEFMEACRVRKQTLVDLHFHCEMAMSNE